MRRFSENTQTACAARRSAISGTEQPSSARMVSVCAPSAGTGSMRADCFVGDLGRSGRQQRRDRACRRFYVAPAFACAQLRMVPHVVHVVDPGIGDLRIVETLHDLRCTSIARRPR